MSNQIIIPRQLDANGNPASGAKANVYETGTLTPVTVYTDTGLSVPHAAPIVANSAGYFAQAFYGGALALKVVVTDSADATLVTYDPAPLVSLSSAAASNVTFTPTTAIPETNVQDAIESVESTLDGRVDPLENAGRLPTTGGAGGAYTLAAAPNTVSAYAAGQTYEFVANHANVGGGSDTLNVDSLGGVVLKIYSSGVAKADIDAGKIQAGDIIRVIHDGTHFVVVSGIRSSEGVSGEVEAATTAEMDAGTADKFPDAAKVKARIDATAVGVGQTWTDVSGLRTAGNDIQNTTGRPIMVSVVQTGGTQRSIEVGATTGSYVLIGYTDGSSGIESTVSFIVPDTHYYKVGASGGTISAWVELT